MDVRSALLDAALRLFAESGYDAVGVQTVVEAVNVTKPTLYHYFGSKRGLFAAVVERDSTPLLAAVADASAYRGDIVHSITEVVRVHFDFAHEHTIFYRMLLSMWFAPPSSDVFPIVADVLDRQYGMLEGMFRRAADDHGNMRGRHAAYAVSLKGMIDTYIGIMIQRGSSTRSVDIRSDDVIYRIVHQFMYGIFS